MSVAYMKAGGLVDCVDAGMGACMVALEMQGNADFGAIMSACQDDWDDWDRSSRRRGWMYDGEWLGDPFSMVE